MYRLLNRILIIVVWALPLAGALSQPCITPTDVLQEVVSVEQSDNPISAKISRLEILRKRFDACGLATDSLYARVLHRLGDLYRMDGDLTKGIRLTKDAIAINRRPIPAASRSYLTNSYYNLGIYYAQLSDFERSNEYFDSCMTAGMQSVHKTNIVLMAAEQKCFNFLRMGEYQMIISAADHGLWIAKRNNRTGYRGILLQQKAQAQLRLGLTDVAERTAHDAHAVLKSEEMPGEYVASALGTIARVMVARGNEVAAIKYFNESIALNMKLGNWHQSARDYHDLGYFYDFKLRNPEKAIDYYQRGIRALSNQPEPYQLAGLYNNLGIVYWRNGEYEKALQYYQKGLQALPVGLKDSALSATLTADMIRRISNDYFVAALLENKGESLLLEFKRSGNRDYLAYALNSFVAADKVIDQMRWKQVNEKSKLFWRENTRKMYEHAVETCYLLNDIDRAFFFFEKSRAVLLNDRLNELGARKSLSPDDEVRDRELREQWQITQTSLQRENLDPREKDELHERWHNTQQKLKAHTANLRNKYPYYFRYKLDTTTITRADLRKKMAIENQTFIEYFTAADAVYILLISADTSVFKKVEYGGFKEDVNSFLNLCSNAGSLNSAYPDFLRLSNKLYRQLFHSLPVTTKRVAVSFDDYFIPFECLITNPAENNSFLLRDHVFLYAYSADFLLRDGSDDSLGDSMMGVAPVFYQSQMNLSPLKGAEESLNTILDNFNKSFSLTRETATRESFLESFHNYAIVHVYSHAMADYAGEEPRLFFHDQPVMMGDLQLLPEVKTQLMVLSGCETGVGKTIRGEGVLSLARGFAAAGIPSTITTLWSVDDRVTYRIMENFYRHMSLGSSSDEALQKAKLDFLDQHDGENELPYYWASTVALGKSMKVEGDKLQLGSIGLTVLLLAAVTSLAVFLLRKKFLLL